MRGFLRAACQATVAWRVVPWSFVIRKSEVSRPDRRPRARSRSRGHCRASRSCSSSLSCRPSAGRCRKRRRRPVVGRSRSDTPRSAVLGNTLVRGNPRGRHKRGTGIDTARRGRSNFRHRHTSARMARSSTPLLVSHRSPSHIPRRPGAECRRPRLPKDSSWLTSANSRRSSRGSWRRSTRDRGEALRSTYVSPRSEAVTSIVRPWRGTASVDAKSRGVFAVRRQRSMDPPFTASPPPPDRRRARRRRTSHPRPRRARTVAGAGRRSRALRRRACDRRRRRRPSTP